MADPFNPQRPFPQPARSFGTEQPSDAGPVSAGYQEIDLRRGLVAYYPFDIVRMDRDPVVGNDGEFTGAPAPAGGPEQLSAVDLAGGTIYLTAPPLGIGSQLTLSAWIRTTDDTGGRYIVARDDGTDSAFAFYVPASNPSALAFAVTSGATTHTLVADETGIDIADGEWHHVCATYSGEIGRVYVDGVADPSVLAADSIDPSDAPVTVGARSDGTGSFEGALGDVRLYSRALPVPEVRRLSTVSTPLGTVGGSDTRTGLIHEYHLDGDATDSVGTLDGENTGAPYTVGHRAQAVDFDRSNQNRVGFPTAQFPNDTTPRSVSVWIRPEHASSDTTAVTATYFGLFRARSGQLRFRTNVNGDTYIYRLVDPVTLGEWYHLVVTYDGATFRGYANGSRVTTSAEISGAWRFSATSAPGFGSQGSKNYYGGAVDEVRYYDRVLTDEEISEMYEYGRRRFENPVVMIE